MSQAIDILRDALEILRAINVALSLGTAVAFAIRINDVWGQNSPGGRTLRVGILLLILTGSYGSAESYLMNAPIGARTPFVSLSCLVILIGLWRTRHERP